MLVDGLPNWRSAVYYYRKARKVGLLEGSLLLFVIITVGQYFVAWAVYLEKKYTMVSESRLNNEWYGLISSRFQSQLFESKSKKVKKANINVDSILNEIPRPSFKNTLPFQIPLGIYHLLVSSPSMIKESVTLVADEIKKEQERKQREQEEEELLKKLAEER